MPREIRNPLLEAAFVASVDVTKLGGSSGFIGRYGTGAGPQALEKLHALNVELEMLRSLLRVAYEVQFISGKSLGFIIGQIDEVGRMRGGWARHCGGSSSKSES